MRIYVRKKNCLMVYLSEFGLTCFFLFASVDKKMVKTFLANRLEEVNVNYIYSHIANPMITTRSYMCVEPFELYLDLKSLRRGIIKVVDPEDEPFGVLLHDSGMV